MKIYIAHSTAYDFKVELYRPMRESDLASVHEIIFPHENNEELFDSKNLFKNGCDLIIAEVSFSSTGMGIELGWANALEIPIVCLYKKGVKPSGSLKAVSADFIEYDSTDDMLRKIKEHIVRIK